MFYYVLPGAGMYGGVKKGFHCADLLTASGVPCSVATPCGERPTWFQTAVTIIDHPELLRACQPGDTVLFSYPPDATLVDRLPARRRIVHMQGASTPADLALMQRNYEFISHGLHMSYELLRHGRVAPYVPIGVPDLFRWRGEVKEPKSVAVMSRKHSQFVGVVKAALPDDARLTIIDGLSETSVAARLKASDVFVAISTDEAFGLPPLEAMCAGCCVVGFPGIGGFEFMRHAETAHLVANDDGGALVEAVRHIMASSTYRDALRRRAMEHAGYYTLERERAYLLRALRLAQD
jgi:glycosyltransferase involved in cell wall biosynthesis